MTYPTEFRSQSKTIGNSNILHPIYTFTINLNVAATEKIGPNTNQRSPIILHPDRYDSDPDRGQSNIANHNAQISSWIPGFLRGENIVINSDGTVTAYGQKAVYLKKNFVDVANPMLTLTNEAPYTSTSAHSVRTYTVTPRGGLMCAGSSTPNSGKYLYINRGSGGIKGAGSATVAFTDN